MARRTQTTALTSSQHWQTSEHSTHASHRCINQACVPESTGSAHKHWRTPYKFASHTDKQSEQIQAHMTMKLMKLEMTVHINTTALGRCPDASVSIHIIGSWRKDKRTGTGTGIWKLQWPLPSRFPARSLACAKLKVPVHCPPIRRVSSPIRGATREFACVRAQQPLQLVFWPLLFHSVALTVCKTPYSCGLTYHTHSFASQLRQIDVWSLHVCSKLPQRNVS